MATCLSIVGLISLVITNLAIVISFATPFWLENTLSLWKDGVSDKHRGLWAVCDNTNCRWFFNEGFHYTKYNETWFRAVQGLFGVGLGLGLISLLVATISLCCECKTCSLSNVVAGILLLAFLSLGVAVILFGVKANKEYYAQIWNSTWTFSWSFWLGIAAAGLALLTSILYACEGRRYYY